MEDDESKKQKDDLEDLKKKKKKIEIEGCFVIGNDPNSYKSLLISFDSISLLHSTYVKIFESVFGICILTAILKKPHP